DWRPRSRRAGGEGVPGRALPAPRGPQDAGLRQASRDARRRRQQHGAHRPRGESSPGLAVRRVSAVLAGLAIGIGALLVPGPIQPTTITVVPPSAEPAPAAPMSPIACDQKIAVTLGGIGLQTVASAWSPDGTKLALGGSEYRRFGPYIPDEQRILILTVSSLEVRDIARGLGPVWSNDGSRLVFREAPADRNSPTSDLVIYDVATSQEGARIPNAGTNLGFGRRGEDVRFGR